MLHTELDIKALLSRPDKRMDHSVQSHVADTLEYGQDDQYDEDVSMNAHKSFSRLNFIRRNIAKLSAQSPHGPDENTSRHNLIQDG